MRWWQRLLGPRPGDVTREKFEAAMALPPAGRLPLLCAMRGRGLIERRLEELIQEAAAEVEREPACEA